MDNEILNKILEGQNMMQKDIADIKAKVDKIETDVEFLKTDMNNLTTKVNDIDRVVMKIEYEHGYKINVLLDAVTCNNEKYQELKKENIDKFNKIEFKVMSYGARIEKVK